VFANRAAKRVQDIENIRPATQTSMKKTAKVGPNLMFQIKEIMDRYVGLLRSEKKLREAEALVDSFHRMFEEGIHIINAESRNVTVVARLVIESALKRKESRGLHYMIDYPDKDHSFTTDTITKINEPNQQTHNSVVNVNRKKDGTRRN
jgi:L-aspartate oxidase